MIAHLENSIESTGKILRWVRKIKIYKINVKIHTLGLSRTSFEMKLLKTQFTETVTHMVYRNKSTKIYNVESVVLYNSSVPRDDSSMSYALDSFPYAYFTFTVQT